MDIAITETVKSTMNIVEEQTNAKLDKLAASASEDRLITRTRQNNYMPLDIQARSLGIRVKNLPEVAATTANERMEKKLN